MLTPPPMNGLPRRGPCRSGPFFAVAGLMLACLPALPAQTGDGGAAQTAAPGAATAPTAAAALAAGLPADCGVVETRHGTAVADPWRCLERGDDPAVRSWVERQGDAARAALDALPARPDFERRLQRLWRQERHGLPQPGRSGELLFTFHDGVAEQPVLRYRPRPEADARTLLDPNALGDDAPVSLADFALSPDGRWLAYALSESGSDWRRIRVLRVADGSDTGLVIERVKFSAIAWTADSGGFFYSRYPDPPAEAASDFDALAHQQLRYHRLGSDPAKDRVIRHDPRHPQRGYGAQVSEDGRWLLVSSWEGTRFNLLHVADLGDGSAPDLDADLRPIVDRFHADFRVIGSRGHHAFVLTDAGAPRGRIVAVDLRRPQPQHWRELLPESDDVLREAVHAGDRLVVHALRDVVSVLRVIDEDGAERASVTLPGLGAVEGLSGRRDHPALYYRYSSRSQPPELRRLRLADGEQRRLHAASRGPQAQDCRSERGFATSRDATPIPVLVSRCGADAGPRPTLLYVYGGFNVPLQPRYSVPAAAWLEAGGAWAVVHARGGGEYGRAWHEAGILDDKENTFDDVVAAAAWLKRKDIATAQSLALHGASNGGMVVGAVVNRRPDLFAASVPAVGVMDLLRFHRFTIGWAWKPDYGDPEVAGDFARLRRISPYHNIRPAAYPATLVVTADHDDRVAPAHSFKYAAALQAAQRGAAPVRLRVQRQAGHGAGKGMSARIAEWSDILAFVHAHTSPAPARAALSAPPAAAAEGGDRAK